MALFRCASGGGGAPTINVATVSGTNSSTTVATFNLSSIPGASSFEVGANMFPVAKQLRYAAGNVSNIPITYTFSYNASTQVLTLTLSGSTAYVHFPSSAQSASVDVYYLS